MISLYMAAHNTSEDDLLQVQARSMRKNFTPNERQTEFQLDTHELPKFLLRSIIKSRQTVFTRSFSYENSLRSTRRSAQNILKVRAPESKLIKQSMKYRGSILHNPMISAAVLPENVKTRNMEQIQRYNHKLKSSFIVNKSELIKFIFG